MSQRIQLYLLGALLVILAAVTYFNWNSSPQLIAALAGSDKFEPMGVENPSLRLDKLERIRTLEYHGSRRNIFSAQPPPPPVPVVKEELPPPRVEPPLQVPFKFYGIVADPKSGKKRACFTNGEDVFILAEGELLQNRYRLLRIGDTTADVEEIQTGKRATLPLEQPGV